MERNKTCCEKCKRYISLSNFKKHFNACLGPKRKKLRGVDFDPNRGYKDGTRKAWNKGRTKETCDITARIAKKLVVSMQGIKHPAWTKEQRDKQSLLKKKYFQENPEKHPNRLLANNRTSYTYPEKIAADWLTAAGITYEKNKRVDIYYPDFVVGKIIIEIDGEYWHNQERDKARDLILSSYGYTIFRIKSKERIVEKLSEIFKNECEV
jgi:very-short-patch-repair endonuclease